MRILVVGAGHGGFQLGVSLRQAGFSGDITLVDPENGIPYQRPPLSKDYLKHGDAARLPFRPEAFLDQQRLTLLPGRRITGIDRMARSATTDRAEILDWDHLVLAPGAETFYPPIPGIDLPGILPLRTLSDADALRDSLAQSTSAVVIGGGFIGLEFAASARAAGLEVTVVEAGPRVMARAVSTPVSDLCAAMHRSIGTRLELGQPVAAILAGSDGRAAEVRLVDGRDIRADILILAAGVRPRTDLAAMAGLTIDNGIAVNALLQTSDPAISALGDCASFPDPRLGRQVRLESVQAATDQARAIAARLTGSPAPYAALPWFWSFQGDWKLQIAGFDDRSDLAHEDVVHQPVGDSGHVIFRLQGDVLRAVETVNAPAQHMAARKLLSKDRALTRAALARAGWNLATLALASAV